MAKELVWLVLFCINSIGRSDLRSLTDINPVGGDSIERLRSASLRRSRTRRPFIVISFITVLFLSPLPPSPSFPFFFRYATIAEGNDCVTMMSLAVTTPPTALPPLRRIIGWDQRIAGSIEGRGGRRVVVLIPSNVVDWEPSATFSRCKSVRN